MGILGRSGSGQSALVDGAGCGGAIADTSSFLKTGIAEGAATAMEMRMTERMNPCGFPQTYMIDHFEAPGSYVSHFLPPKRISSSYNPSLAEPVGILCSCSRNNISELNAGSPRKNPDRVAAVHITAQRTGWLEGHAIPLAPTKKHANGPNALCTPTFRVYLSRREVGA